MTVCFPEMIREKSKWDWTSATSLVYWNPFSAAECPRSLEHFSTLSSQGGVSLQFECRRKASFLPLPLSGGKVLHQRTVNHGSIFLRTIFNNRALPSSNPWQEETCFQYIALSLV